MLDKTVGFGWDYRHHADKTVGFGWDSTHHGREDSRIWMRFPTPWQTRQKDLDGIAYAMADKIVR